MCAWYLQWSEEASDPLELESWVAASLQKGVGNEAGSFARAVGALNC